MTEKQMANLYKLNQLRGWYLEQAKELIKSVPKDLDPDDKDLLSEDYAEYAYEAEAFIK